MNNIKNKADFEEDVKLMDTDKYYNVDITSFTPQQLNHYIEELSNI